MDEGKSLADANKPAEQKNDEKKEVSQQKEKHTAEAIVKEKKVEVAEPVKEEPKKQEKIEQPQRYEQIRPQANAIKKRKHTIQKAFRRLKTFNLSSIKTKLGHYWTEYTRVLHLARKPTRSEYRELAIMVAVGTAIIGGIGFLVQLGLQFI
jgi:protein translocase SEC61 complex gamma subunit